MQEIVSIFMAALTIASICSMLRIGMNENCMMKAVLWSLAAAVTGSIVTLQIMGMLL